MADPHDKPWIDSGLGEFVVKGPPRWHRWGTWLAVALGIVVLATPVFLSVQLFRGEAHQAFVDRRHEIIASLADQFGRELDSYLPGTCVQHAQATLGEGLLPGSCSTPHDGELTAVVALGSGPYPGDTHVAQRSRTLCDKATKDFVRNGQGADLTLVIDDYTPNVYDWGNGHQRTVCVAFLASGGKIHGSLEKPT